MILNNFYNYTIKGVEEILGTLTLIIDSPNLRATTMILALHIVFLDLCN